MNVLDGAELTHGDTRACDVVVVGSGPAGAVVARDLAGAGASVVVVEEGPWMRPDEFPEDSFTAMSRAYRALGASVLLGNAPMPYVQGRLLGGSSVINGAICWRFPRDVFDHWVAMDPRLGEDLPWDRLEAAQHRIEQELNVAPTDPAIAGRNNTLLAAGAEALGLAHRPILRNVRSCQGLGRCLQGCPAGHKMSMDVTFLPAAAAQGALLATSVRVERILLHAGRAIGIMGRAAGGGTLRVYANRAVVLAASAVQTPALLLANGIRHGPVGRNFQCHPGVSMAGFFSDPVHVWRGATQGHEVVGLRHEGIKIEALGYDMTITAMRLKGVGNRLATDISNLANWANWGAAIRASAHGRVRAWRGRVVVSFSLAPDDVARIRRAVSVMGRMMLAAGASFVTPGVHGWCDRVSEPTLMADLERSGPLHPKCYALAVTHMFGTCTMGSRPAASVVGTDFQHHTIANLFVADSSVFPTNLGVNPQLPIMTLATLCADAIARSPAA